MKDGISRSPMFYVGDKYKLIREIRSHFPVRINRLIEPFVGGGSVMMNVNADGFLLNDIDSYVIGLHQMLCGYVGRGQDFYTDFYRIVDQYGLSLSFRENPVPQELRKAHPKTYFAKYNKEAYRQLKSDFIALGENFVVLDKKSGSLLLPVDNLATSKSIPLTEKDIEKTVYNSLKVANKHFYVASNKQLEQKDTLNQDYIQNKELLSFNKAKVLQKELVGNKTNRSASVLLSPVKKEETVQIAEMER